MIARIIILGRCARRLPRASPDKIANASAEGDVLNAMRTAQSYPQELFEARRFAGAVKVAFKTALTRIGAWAGLTAVFIVLVLAAALVFVLWLGAQGLLAGRKLAVFRALAQTYGAALPQWIDIAPGLDSLVQLAFAHGSTVMVEHLWPAISPSRDRRRIVITIAILRHREAPNDYP